MGQERTNVSLASFEFSAARWETLYPGGGRRNEVALVSGQVQLASMNLSEYRGRVVVGPGGNGTVEKCSFRCPRSSN